MRSLALALAIVLIMLTPTTGRAHDPRLLASDPSGLWTPPRPSEFIPSDQIRTAVLDSLQASTDVPGLELDFPLGLPVVKAVDLVDPNDASFPVIARRYVAVERRWHFPWDAAVWLETDTAVATGPDGSRYRFTLPLLPLQPQWDPEPVQVIGDMGAVLAVRPGLWRITLVDGTRLYYADPGSAGLGRGRLRMAVDALGRAIYLNRSPAGEIDSLADHYGRLYELSISGEGIVVCSDVGTVEYGMDVSGRLISVDRIGYSASFCYDPSGRLIGWTVNGVSSDVSYDAVGRVTGVRSGGGEYGIDYPEKAGYITITDPGGHHWYCLTDGGDRVSGWYSPDGTVIEYRRDQKQHTMVDRYGRFGRDRFTFDRFGRLTGYEDTRGDSTTWEYGESGRVSVRTGPQGAVTSYSYNSHGALASVDDGTRTITLAYDPWGRIETIMECCAGATWIRYAGKTPPARIILPSGQVTAWYYDLAGLPAAVTDGESVRRIERSSDGLAVGVTWDDGRSARIRYQDGLICSLTYSDGSGIGLKRDQSGAPVVADFGRGPWRIDRDRLGRTAALVSPSGRSWSFDRDPAGRVVRITAGIKALDLVWDDLQGTIRAVRDANRRWWDCERGPSGVLLSLALDGESVEIAHDGYGWDADDPYPVITALSLVAGADGDRGLWRAVFERY